MKRFYITISQVIHADSQAEACAEMLEFLRSVSDYENLHVLEERPAVWPADKPDVELSLDEQIEIDEHLKLFQPKFSR